VSSEQAMLDEAQGYLNYVVERLNAKGIGTSTHVRVGHPVHEILEHGEKYADLIVMTTHGRSGLSAWALGAVADKVVRHSRIPTLLFRADMPERME
jgi:nucleotide-binding universal stress UspA family protein